MKTFSNNKPSLSEQTLQYTKTWKTIFTMPRGSVVDLKQTQGEDVSNILKPNRTPEMCNQQTVPTTVHATNKHILPKLKIDPFVGEASLSPKPVETPMQTAG
jgi:hypothetical protein